MTDPATALLVVQLAVGLYVAYKLSQQKTPSVKQDTPVPNATRGRFCDYLLGNDRTGLTHNWVGKPVKTSEDADGGGKGSKKQKVTVYRASGWHVLGVGPAWSLKGIRESGHYIFATPINRESHPSGSSVTVPGHGTFRVFWGEPDQPVNSFLGDPSRVGAMSRWPYHFYIEWTDKRLGTAPVWPVLDYEWEKRNDETHLSNTPAYIPNEYNLVKVTEGSGVITTFSYFIVENTAGPPGTNFFRIRKDVGGILVTPDETHLFYPGSVVKISDTQAPTPFKEGEYPVLYSVYNPGVPGDPTPGNSMDVYLAVNVDQVSGGGYGYKGGLQGVAIVATDTNELFPDGMNPIHMIAGILFDEWPHGLKRDKSRYDLASFEDAAQICDDERIPGHVHGEDGEEAGALIAGLLQDAGFVLALDAKTGLYRLQALREPPLDVTELGLDVLLPPLPQVERVHGARPADRVAFIYPDRKMAYKDVPVHIDDDGQASQQENQRSRRVQMTLPIDFPIAAIVAERRGPEALAGGARIPVWAARQARELQPGAPLRVAVLNYALRVNAVRAEPLTSRTLVECIKDCYGSVISGNKPQLESPIPEPPTPPQPDLMFALIEVPGHLSFDGVARAVIPRVRASADVAHAKLYLSADDSTYVEVGDDFTLCAGGVLTEGIPANSLRVLEQGPEFTPVGPDVDMIQDLSGDEAAWRLGRQIIVFDDGSADPMVGHLRNVTAVGGGDWRLDGLILARYDTPKKAVPLGTPFYIFSSEAIPFIEDALLSPGAVVYAKTQPFNNFGAVSLAQVLPYQRTLIGKGIVPMPLVSLRTADLTNSYLPGADVALRWQYRSRQVQKTGAGLQGYGVVHGHSEPEGTFTVRMLTTGDVLKRTVEGLTTPEYLYDNGDLQADFGSEPAAFKVQVENLLGGYSSGVLELTVEKAT